MQAVVMHEPGGPEVLGLEEVELPALGEGQVLVEVHAISINPIDWKLRRGIVPKPLPAILGNDFSGVVASSRAEGYAEGDEVFGIAASGAYAEYLATPGAIIAKKPAGVTHLQAAALPVAALTAWQALFDHGGLQTGQRALIAAAAAGVGHFAVQLASRAGAHTIGIGSARNREFVLGLGAEEYIDYANQDVAQTVSGVDLAFDAVGGETTSALLATLRPGGVLVTIANAAPEEEASQRGARAVNFSMTPTTEQLSRIAELAAAGEIHAEIAATLPLAEIRRAHELSESGHTRGKIVLTLEQ
jgi:NADPH:quinone reductase-like Zn-dependent oxidoreductase